MSKKIPQTWSEFKATVSAKNLAVQYEQKKYFYHVFASENGHVYHTDVYIEATPAPVGSDQEDFEDNYEAASNKALHPSSPDFKTKVVASSLPLNTVTWFTTCGDNVTVGSEEIGSIDNRIAWDFSNTDNDVVSPPTGFYQKSIEFEFLDDLYIKEGTIYFHDALKGSYVDLYVVCKDTKYYLNNAGTPTQASGDTKVYHYVTAHPMTGSVPMGDELNTEQAMENPVSTDFKFCVVITVPDTDAVSHGVIELECYRSRTMIL